MEMGWKIAAVLMILAGLGTAYNWAVAKLERSRYHRFVNTALLVVVGVAFTVILSSLLIGLSNAMLIGACFMASGLPMFLGSYIRQIQSHAHEEERIKRITAELAQ